MKNKTSTSAKTTAQISWDNIYFSIQQKCFLRTSQVNRQNAKRCAAEILET